MGLSDSDIDKYICSATTGDAKALKVLLCHFHDPLLKYIRDLMKPNRSVAFAAEDILQEVLTIAFRRISKLEARGNNAFFTWLRVIADRQYTNAIKAQGAEKRGGKVLRLTPCSVDGATASSILKFVAGKDPTASRVALRKEAIAALMMVMSDLDSEHRQVIDLRFGGGIGPAEIATRLGKSPGAVKMMLKRALVKLRTLLAAKFDDLSIGG